MANQDTPLTLAFSITVGDTFAGTQEFEQEMVTVGKGAAAVLQIDDDQLADLHAAVQLGDDGSVTVLDLGSDSGTLLNGEPINNEVLNDGDRIQIGNTTLQIGLTLAEAEPDEDTDNVTDAVAQAQHDHAEAEAEIGEAEDVMDFVLRSGTSESDIGINRNAPKVLEVAEIWSGTVMNVRHFDQDTKAVYVGDRQSRQFRVLSGILTSILVFGTAFFMIKSQVLESHWDNAIAVTRATLDADGDLAITYDGGDSVKIDMDAPRYPGVPNNVAKIAAWQAEIDTKKAEERARIKAERDTEKASVRAEAEQRMAGDRKVERTIRTRLRAARSDDPDSKLTESEVRDDLLGELITAIEKERDTAKEEAEKAAMPRDPYKEFRDEWMAATKASFEKAIRRNRDQSVMLVPPQFELYERPNYEAFIEQEMLPVARKLAPEGKLNRNYLDEFKRFTKEYDRYDDLDEKRVVADVVLTTRIHRGTPQSEPLVLVAGNDAEKIYAMGPDFEVQIIPIEEEVYLWDPTEEEIAKRVDVYKEIQKALYANAKARRQGGARCDALQQLIQFEENKNNFEYNAQYANCLANKNEYDKAREFAERAIEVAPEDKKPTDVAANYLIALQVKARIDLTDAFGHEETDESGAVVWVGGDPANYGNRVVPAEKRAFAEKTNSDLQEFAIQIKNPGALKAVDHAITKLRQQALRLDQQDQVRSTIYLALLIVLLLPLGFGFDEIRSRKMAQDFFVSSDNLPNDHFAIAEQAAGGLTANFTADSVGYLESKAGKISTADLISSGRATAQGKHYQVELGEDERFVNDIGHMVFFIHKVFRHKLQPAPFAQNVDWLFLTILLLLLFIGGGFGLSLLMKDYDPKQEIVTIPDRFVELSVQQIEKEKDKKKPAGNKDAGEGAKAKDKEGKVGKKQHKLKKAKGSKIAIQKSQLDKQIAESTGLLADLNQMTDNSIFGTGGLDASIANAQGGLLGSQYGNQFGSGGLGSRGSGFGGGGTAAGLGGLGTRGTGLGASGYGRGSGFYGKKGGGAPGVRRGSPIILGALDKSLIDRVVKSHLAQIRFCYERELNKNPKLFGKIIVKFVISKSGSVSSATTKASSMKNPIVEQCINKRFLRMRFPSPKGGGIVIVSYPFVFNSQGR